MFITKKYIPRRTFLRGAGVTLALPLLEAMLPAQTPQSQTAAGKMERFVGVWHPHGAAPGYWSPQAEGSDFEFSYITNPLEPYRKQVVLITGLNATSSSPTPEEPGGDHARGAAFLSGARPRKDAVIPYVGVTVDQSIARRVGEDTLVGSIQLAIEDPGNNTGVCNWGYSCAYTNSVSWSTPTQPLPHEINPRIVFERLFGDGSTAKERIARREEDRSVLDAISRKIGPLRNKIGASDRVRLDGYLNDIREIEGRLANVTKGQPDIPTSSVPFGVPESYDEHVKLMYDLTALAFQSDITRVMTLMLGRDSTSKTFPESGFDGPWHTSSHHDDNPERVKQYSKINRYHVDCLAYFAEKLAKTPEAGGTLLDHTLIYKGSNMGNSNRHAHENTPAILVGGLNGRLKGNRHLVFPDSKERTSNLLLSILDLYGIHQEVLGDSTGHLSIA